MSVLFNCAFCLKEFQGREDRPRKYCSGDCRINHKKQIAGMDTERTCESCSATFLPKYSCQKTCSTECKNKLGAKKREKIYNFSCKNCGKNCESHRKNRTTFCSQECYFELIGDRADEWKKERVCVECQEKYTPSYKIQRYCSRKCSMTVVGKEKTETSTKIVNCDWCKKEFVKRLSQLNNKTGNFCSEECSHLFLRDGQDYVIEKDCKNCKEKYKLLYIDREQEFCSRSCAKSGEFHPYWGKEGPMKGKTPWTFGLTKKTDERIAALGEKVSIIQKEQFQNGLRSNKGENNPNWKEPEDRITPIYSAIRECELYKSWRYSVFKRDNFICVLCNDSTKFINADHIKQFALIIKENNIKSLEESYACEELWNTDNGRTLCIDCHKTTPTYGYKGRLKNEN